MKYVYTVWFRDNSLTLDDPDFEWPACFVIESSTEVNAKEWGDHLAQRYQAKSKQKIIKSEVELFSKSNTPGISKLPVIDDGFEANDSYIGW